MTQPPFDPTSRIAGDATPTEPVPTPDPAFVLKDPALVPPPAPGGPPQAPFAFAPVEPEPGPFAAAPGPGPTAAGGWTAPVAPLGPVAGAARRPASGSSRVLTLALGAALLVGAVGVAFAAGRLSAPASSAAGATGNVPGFDRGAAPGLNGNGPLSNGNGPLANGGSQPDTSFDPNANGGFPGDDDNDGFGRGLGRNGFGGLGITGTVTAVTDTSITIKTANGLTLTIERDGTTTYHQQAPAQASDVASGDKVQVQVSGGFRPQQGTDGNVSLGTAGDITIVP